MDADLSSPSQHNQDLQQRTTSRRRARQACVNCHERKVRCNASSAGTPCSNCIADNCRCIPRQRIRRNSKKHALASAGVPGAVQSSSSRLRDNQIDTSSNASQNTFGDFASPTTSLQSLAPNNAPELQEVLSNVAPSSRSQPYSSMGNPGLQQGFNAMADVSGLQSLPMAPRTANFFEGGGWESSPAQFNIFDDDFMTELLGDALNTTYLNRDRENSITGESNIYSHPAQPLSPNGVQMSAWNQIDLPSELRGRNTDDIGFLRSQGCLSIPNRALLGEYLKSYYLYVNPAIPMIPEREFDLLITGDTEVTTVFPSHMSIFVIQAILFASCSFTSEATNFQCGFRSTRDARGAYYRRSKLLFDFEVEKDPFNIARGALLLAYQAPNDNVRRVNCYWLNLAIRSARIADADLYYSSNTDSSRRRCLKRLWWSCIFRDRILPLGLRRPVQIPLDSFDWERGEPLAESDFVDEISQSKVYDEETQRMLIRTLTAMCSLSKALTFAITAAFPIDRNVHQIWDGDDYFDQSIEAIRDAKQRLVNWYDDVIVQFPVPIGLGDVHPSVVLFANIMYIYFRSGLLALCHREALLLEYRASKGFGSNTDIEALQPEIVSSMTDITERMTEVVHQKLAKYLPVSAVAYITLPWIMHILDSKFARTKAEVALKQRRLHIFQDIMNHQTQNFDGVEFVAKLVQKLTEYIDIQVPSLTDSESKPISSWDELLISQPRFYLRICVYLDLAFSKGEFPFRVDQTL